MPKTSYLLALTFSRSNPELFLQVLNLAGRFEAILGFGNDDFNTDLRLIPNPRRNASEIKKALEKTASVRKVSLAALTDPVKETELAEVRKLLLDIGLNPEKVTDDELSLFLNERLKGRYTYHIAWDDPPATTGSVKISIKDVRELPGYSTDMILQAEREQEDLAKAYTMEDFKVESVEFTTMDEEPPEEPEPPPHP
jgi:hypothetical protein